MDCVRIVKDDQIFMLLSVIRTAKQRPNPKSLTGEIKSTSGIDLWSNLAKRLKVHKIEIFLAPNLNFVLFHC